MTKSNITTLRECLSGVRSVGISGHIRPDGDCVGSTLAVYHYISSHYPNISVRIFLEKVPQHFSFLKDADRVECSYPECAPFDLFIACDCSDIERMGNAARYFEQANRTVCIDHHLSNQGFGDYYYIFPDSSSASELVFELIGEEEVDAAAAECLYTGIIHDTGVFQYSSTSAKTMKIGGILMEKGIDYPGIVDRTFYTKTYTQNRILGQALLNSFLELDGRVIVSVLTSEDLKTQKAVPSDLDGIVNQLRITKDTLVALFLYENEDGSFKGSLRVNSDINVALVAQHFGGGGHAKAAGFTIPGPKESAVSQVLSVLKSSVEAVC